MFSADHIVAMVTNCEMIRTHSPMGGQFVHTVIVVAETQVTMIVASTDKESRF